MLQPKQCLNRTRKTLPIIKITQIELALLLQLLTLARPCKFSSGARVMVFKLWAYFRTTHADLAKGLSISVLGLAR